MALDTVNALVSLSEAKAFLKITASSEDGMIETMINRASIWANDYTGRMLKSRNFDEYYDGDCSSCLILRNAPITAITFIRQDIDRVFQTETTIDSGDYFWDANTGIVTLKDGAFLQGKKTLYVNYTAGYTTAPESIKEAVLIYVGHSYRRQYADQKFGVSSETVGDRTTTYTGDEIPAKAKLLLNPYRSEAVFLGF